MLMGKFNIQVDDNTATQLALLHSDIPGYDLAALDFVSLPGEAQENHILKEEDSMICTHLEKVFIHMIDKQDTQIFKFCDDYARNKRKLFQHLKYAEIFAELFAHMQLFYATFL